MGSIRAPDSGEIETNVQKTLPNGKKTTGERESPPRPAADYRRPFCRSTRRQTNPKGIPRLYLSTTANAAMSEVRPWIGAMVSLAQFKTLRALTLVDCSVLRGKYIDLILDRKFDEPISPEKFDQIVWAAIDRAFSEPTTRADDTAEYASTQVLAEFFESQGYDGVAYKSAFGEDEFRTSYGELKIKRSRLSERSGRTSFG